MFPAKYEKTYQKSSGIGFVTFITLFLVTVSGDILRFQGLMTLFEDYFQIIAGPYNAKLTSLSPHIKIKVLTRERRANGCKSRHIRSGCLDFKKSLFLVKF